MGMKDSEILSAFQPTAAATGAAELAGDKSADVAAAWVFDACHLGVVLRAVLAVAVLLGVAALFVARNASEWIGHLSLWTIGALGATVAWLIIACSLKQVLARLSVRGQYAAGMALGALCGLYGCGMLALAQWVDPAPWLGSAAAGALLAGLMVQALVWRVRSRTPATTAAQLAELQARIRPHFLFNTLNSAIALVRAEPARAEGLLEDLSDLFRSALADHGEATRLGDEITLARRYLDIEAVRFGERLRVEWALDPAADAAPLPPLLLQPLLENAVRHGVEPSTEGAQIKVSTQRRGDRVLLRVTNTVPAGSGPAGHGLALNNVRQRLALLHDVQASFRAGLKGSGADAVYQVRIEVPAGAPP